MSTSSRYSTSSLSSSSGDYELTLQIVRDEGVCGDWMNRYCRNAETHEVLYYCDVYDDSNVEIHRGNKYGPIIAKSSTCRSKPGGTDIFITGRRRRNPLDHIHHDNLTSLTHFIEDGQKYHWNGQSELVEDATGNVVAQLCPARDTLQHNLVIKSHQNLTDHIVMTALMVQERADEAKSYF